MLALFLALGANAQGLDDGAQLWTEADALAIAGHTQEALTALAPVLSRPELSARASSLAIYLLADTQQFAAAEDFANNATVAHPSSGAVWLARGYALRRAGKQGPALHSYQEVLRLEPSNREACQGLVYALRDLGSASRAFDEASKHADLFDRAYLDELRSEKAVEMYRMARTMAGSMQKNQLLSEALLLLQDSSKLSRNELTDQLLVLHEAGQDAAVVQLYESALSTTGVGQWAEVAVAGSYGKVGKPKSALSLLERAHQARPKELDVTYALVYLYCDLQRFDKAQKLTDSLVAALPANSPELPFARQLQAQAALWSGDFQRAGLLLSSASTAYPDHAGIAKVHVAWLNETGRRAEARRQLLQLISQDSDDLEAKLMLVELRGAAALGAARQELDELAHSHEGDARVVRSRQEVQKALAGSVWASAVTTEDRDSKGMTFDMSATSATLTDWGLRIVTQSQGSQTDARGDRVVQRQDAIGVSGSLGTSWTGQVMALRNDHDAKAGVSLRLSGEVSDGLSLSLRASSLDSEVPALGVAEGLTARSLGAQLSSVLFGALQGSLASSVQELSDGNVRSGLSLGVSGKGSSLGATKPDWALRAGVDRASSSEVSYFSPLQQSWSELEVGLRLPAWNPAGAQLVGARPYAAVGTFAQKGFGPLFTSNVGLGFNWAIGGGVSVALDLHRVRRPYDGDYTTLTAGQLSISAKLP